TPNMERILDGVYMSLFLSILLFWKYLSTVSISRQFFVASFRLDADCCEHLTNAATVFAMSDGGDHIA
ncbi:MAG: hypothetical protein OXG78_04880, partial [Chloroflexi bacterium]|nr:hypothetical protein [Chloroflexota bacterium]